MIRLLILAAFLIPLGGGFAVAQSSLNEQVAEARKEAAAAEASARRLEAEAETAHDEAAKARAQSKAVMHRIAEAEADITAAEARLAEIREFRANRRARLASKQEPAARLAGALASLARRPPVLALIQAGPVRDTVRTRAALAAALPVIRARTEALRADIAAGKVLDAEARRAFAARTKARDDLERRKSALAALEAQEIARFRSLSRNALAASDQAISRGEEVRTLASESMRQTREAVAARSLATLPAPSLPPFIATRPSRPVYRLPVQGRLVAGMGELSAAGIHSRGLTFTVAPDTQAFAPAGGRIVYAGGFRSFGEIVIIDHGGGWTSLVTGLATLGVKRGEIVVLGAPIGRTGRRPVTVELRRGSVPFPIAPLVAIG